MSDRDALWHAAVDDLVTKLESNPGDLTAGMALSSLFAADGVTQAMRERHLERLAAIADIRTKHVTGPDAPQGTTTGRTAPPASEGLKTASRAVRSSDSDSDDPTEETTHP